MYLVNIQYADGTMFPNTIVGMPQGDYQAIARPDGALILIPKNALMICNPITPPPTNESNPIEPIQPPVDFFKTNSENVESNDISEIELEDVELEEVELEEVLDEIPINTWAPTTYGCTVPEENRKIITSAERKARKTKS